MAQALSIGFVLGMTPLLGISSLLAVLIAAMFRLNQVAIQVANWAAYPAQILLFIPYIRAGEWLLGMESVAVSPTEIASMFNEDFYASLQIYGRSLAAGFTAWAVTAIPLSVALNYPFKIILLRTLYKQNP
jgi:uncharacterized protein (DUF2062 family)